MKEIKTFGLTEAQTKAAEAIINGNLRVVDGYHIEDSEDFKGVWYEDAVEQGDTDYAEFLKAAINGEAEIYSLYDDLQPLGDILVY